MDRNCNRLGGDGDHRVALAGLTTWVAGEMNITSTCILAVYRTYQVMIVVEAEGGLILELPLNDLADVYELLPPLLWQALGDEYQVFDVIESASPCIEGDVMQ